MTSSSVVWQQSRKRSKLTGIDTLAKNKADWKKLCVSGNPTDPSKRGPTLFFSVKSYDLQSKKKKKKKKNFTKKFFTDRPTLFLGNHSLPETHKFLMAPLTWLVLASFQALMGGGRHKINPKSLYSNFKTPLNHLNRIQGIASFQKNPKLSRSELGFWRKKSRFQYLGANFQWGSS